MKHLYAVCLNVVILFTMVAPAVAQVNDTLPTVDYDQREEYEIGGIEVTGANYSDDNALKAIAGLSVGDRIRIPGEKVTKALKALWDLKLFTDIQINQTEVKGDVVFLEIAVQERPRFSRHSYKGVKKSYHDNLNERINPYLTKGGIVTQSMKVNAKNAIIEFFREKGHLDVEVNVREVEDEKKVHAVRLVFEVDEGSRVKIQDITFSGNDELKDKKVRKLMDNTKPKRRLFAKSIFIRDDYEDDKEAIISHYNTMGFRDARIVDDSIWREDDGDLMIHIDLEEGNRYYFRDITWKGNSIYKSETLEEILGISKGDPYNQELLQTRLQFSMDGRDISSLYMDNGYLFFRVEPTEVAIEGDSIDLEMRIYEGPQATIDQVVIKGNDRTHEHVIRRELRTRPGEKFSRSDIIRSQREIINLGYFNPEALDINTPVNPQRGTVDIEYTVEEKPSDQLELSAGWGGISNGVIGTLGVSFNNFSLRNIFNKEAWKPLPQGDGQRLSLRAQSNAKFLQSYNFSFTEPWLGGKKPNSFTLAGYYSKLNQELFGGGILQIANLSIGLGTRLRWPDDNFVYNTTLNIQNLELDDYPGFLDDDGNPVENGSFNNFNINQSLTRTTVNDLIYPTSGSRFTLSVQLTPPYSLFDDEDNYEDQPNSEKFRWLEYHKWRFNAEWYTAIAGKLVLKAAAKIGAIGFYNEDIGLSPFERFQLGGDGLNNQQFALTGFDVISLRGYEVEDLENNISPVTLRPVPTPLFNKFTVELRYPLSTNPNSTIFFLTFLEGGNSYRNFDEYNPFDLKRSAGMGLRVFLPMFGTLGFDYGFGWDRPSLIQQGVKWTEYANFNLILGFEPE